MRQITFSRFFCYLSAALVGIFLTTSGCKKHNNDGFDYTMDPEFRAYFAPATLGEGSVFIYQHDKSTQMDTTVVTDYAVNYGFMFTPNDPTSENYNYQFACSKTSDFGMEALTEVDKATQQVKNFFWIYYQAGGWKVPYQNGRFDTIGTYICEHLDSLAIVGKVYRDVWRIPIESLEYSEMYFARNIGIVAKRTFPDSLYGLVSYEHKQQK